MSRHSHKRKVDSSELEGLDENDELLQTPIDGMVSIRFVCVTDAGCCSCCTGPSYFNFHHIVLPETTKVSEFLTIASNMVGAKDQYTIGRVNGIFSLRNNDPIGPTLRSYEWIESPFVALGIEKNDCCCLMI